MPEELDNNSELLSPKDEDQGNLLKGIVNCSDAAQFVVQVR